MYVRFLAVVSAAAVCAIGVADPYYLVSTDLPSSIRKYSLTGEYLGDLVPPDSTHINRPQHMAIDRAGRLYVANYGQAGVSMFDVNSGAFLGEFGASQLAEPAFLAISPNNELVVSSLANDRIVRYELGTGAYMGEFVTPGVVDAPHGIHWTADGRVLISAEQQIVQLGSDGSVTPFSQTLSRPMTILPSPDGSQFLVATFFGEVERIDAVTGAFISHFTTEPFSTNPDGMTFTPEGNLAVCYWGSNRVRVYDPASGAALSTLARRPDGLLGPNDVILVPEPATGFLVLVLAASIRRRA